MSKTAYTPGPWSVTAIRTIHHKPKTAHESTMLARVESRRNPDEAFANAQLIAAAPELLEALKALLTMMDRGTCPRKFDEALSWRENDEVARSKALTAIAKAEAAS